MKRKVRRRPYDWGLWMMLARLYEVGDQWQQAIDALAEARRLNPQNQLISEQLARLRQSAKEPSEDNTKGKSANPDTS